MTNLVTRSRRQDDGASAVEYGLLVALIAVVIAAAVGLLGTVLSDTVTDACTSIAAEADCGAP